MIGFVVDKIRQYYGQNIFVVAWCQLEFLHFLELWQIVALNGTLGYLVRQTYSMTILHL